jgi:integrase
MKLTQTGISRLNLSSSKTDEIFFDDTLPGFGIRLREGGSRKYVVHYRQAGIQRRHTIGSVATLNLDEARKRARKILVAVDDGRDPAAEKESKRAASGLIFATVVRDYLEASQRSLKPKTLIGYKGDLERLWKPLHKLALGAISRSIIASHLRIIAKENGPVAANNARGTLSSFYAWAIGEGLTETNPVIGTNTFDTKPRERVLSNAESVAIWKAAPDNDYGHIVRLLMLTGQRRDEIGSLRWSEIDLVEKSIALPSGRTKNGRPHVVPLSDTSLSILRAKNKIRIDDRDLVFGEGEGGYQGWSRAKRSLDAAAKVKNWTLHDLRRTAATRMADLGVQPHIIEEVLNHKSGYKGGIAGVYNHSTYEPEKTAALKALANHWAVTVAQANGENVTPLRKA